MTTGYLLAIYCRIRWSFAIQTLVVLPRLLQHWSTASLLPFAFACTVVGRVGLAAAGWLPPSLTITCSYIILNLGQGLTTTLLKVLMSAAAPADRRGMLLGLLSSSEKLSGVVAPLIGGVLYVRGPSAPAVCSSLVALIGVALTAASTAGLRALSACGTAKKID